MAAVVGSADESPGPLLCSLMFHKLALGSPIDGTTGAKSAKQEMLFIYA